MNKQELLTKYKDGQRDFQSAVFPEISVPNSDLSAANFDYTNFTPQHLNVHEASELVGIGRVLDLDNSTQELASINEEEEEGAGLGKFLLIYPSECASGSLAVGQANFDSSTLINASFRNASLGGICLNNSDARYADFSKSYLGIALIYDSEMASEDNADSSEDMEEFYIGSPTYSHIWCAAEMINANLTGAKFSEANCSYANFRGATLSDAILDYADLENAILCDADLVGSSFNKTNFEGADLSGANLAGTDLSNSFWRVANLSGAILTGANMRRLDLTDGNFSDAELRQVTFSEANLSRANLHSADLFAADLEGVRLELSTLDDANLEKADLCGANLNGASLKATNLQDAEIMDASITDADMQKANLADCNLSGSELDGSNLQDSNLKGANLRNTSLCNVNFCGANLSKADLCGAKLAGANLSQADLIDAKIDIQTYVESAWSPGIIAELYQRGADIINLENFPKEVHKIIWGNEQGLTLYFNTKLTPLDQHLVNGIVLGVLGQDSACRVVEYKEKGDTAIIRLRSPSQQDLETVAEALYQRVWEYQEKAQNAAMVRYAALLSNNELRHKMSNLRERLDRMILLNDTQEPINSKSQQTNHSQRPDPLWNWNMKQDYLRLEQPINVCILYAPEDYEACERLEKHLVELKRQGFITTWSNAQLMPGQDRIRESVQAIGKADIIIILVSPDFLASEGYIQEQMKISINWKNLNNTCMVPILIRPAAWQMSEISHLQPLPTNEKPISLWRNQDEGWVNVTMGIRRLILGYKRKPQE